MGTIWCFGDSNTYGYDPCGFFGGRYADADKWDIELAYDGVHFSEAGHARFADGLANCLSGLEEWT